MVEDYDYLGYVSVPSGKSIKTLEQCVEEQNKLYERNEKMEMAFDKHGREIMVGDTLKVYHFTGAKNKKHYMYKYVSGKTNKYFVIANLDTDKTTYRMNIDGNIHKDIEIVQGFGVDGVPFDQRIEVKGVGVEESPYYDNTFGVSKCQNCGNKDRVNCSSSSECPPNENMENSNIVERIRSAYKEAESKLPLTKQGYPKTCSRVSGYKTDYTCFEEGFMAGFDAIKQELEHIRTLYENSKAYGEAMDEKYTKAHEELRRIAEFASCMAEPVEYEDDTVYLKGIKASSVINHRFIKNLEKENQQYRSALEHIASFYDTPLYSELVDVASHALSDAEDGGI